MFSLLMQAERGKPWPISGAVEKPMLQKEDLTVPCLHKVHRSGDELQFLFPCPGHQFGG